VLCSEAPARIRDLVRYGVAFDSLGGEVALGREAAHSQSRILHAGGDRTGAAIETALGEAAIDPAITILDFTLATKLLRDERGAIRGVEALDLETGQSRVYEAPAVIVATGGAGQLYSHTTNPEVATGDGIALAFEAGAEVMDLEFYQFHPTALRVPDAPAFLISEAVRGEGAVLRNAAGEAFMPGYHALGDLAPRDIVARAIVAEMRASASDHVFLDCTGLKSIDLSARFPGIFAFCMSVGIDMRDQPIPVAPAAHYLMGGVRTDINGRTNIAGLYACGETACTGVHGANRLASNSLLETVVFGKRVVEDLERSEVAAAVPCDMPLDPDLPAGIAPNVPVLQRLMWDCAGIERDGHGLARALETVSTWAVESPQPTRAWHERRQMSILARMVLQAATQRTESRGAHNRSDFPERDDARWRRHLVFRRDD
jgi:L-aspartate oxidase